MPSDGETSEKPRKVRRPKRPWREFSTRFMTGHFAAYPVAFLASIAAMPIAMWVRDDKLLNAGATGATYGVVREAIKDMGLSATEAAQVEIILEFVGIVALAVWVLVHIEGLPWSIAAFKATTRDRLRGHEAPSVRRTRRWFVVSLIVTGAACVLMGIAGWTWLFTL